MADPVQRFTSRVENYVQYRPHYPQAVLETLRAECGLTQDSRIADVGSGPGNLTELFLQNGNVVYAVEPNAAMRETAEQFLSRYPGFRSVAGHAEAMPLPDHSVEFVTAGQAFHWFDRERARAEFLRILWPGGWVALIWNAREKKAKPFLAAYERLLRTYPGENPPVDDRQISQEAFAGFFGVGGLHVKKFPNHQDLDYPALEGRMLSSSYTPEPGHPNYAPLVAELRKLYDASQVNGVVRIEYTTVMYFGQLS